MRRAPPYSLHPRPLLPPSWGPRQAAIRAGKWARGPWAGGPEDEAAVLSDTGASLLCVPLSQPVSVSGAFTTCIYTGYQAVEVALFGRLTS